MRETLLDDKNWPKKATDKTGLKPLLETCLNLVQEILLESITHPSPILYSAYCMVKSFPSVIILFNTFFIRIILASPSSAEEYEVKNKMQKIRLRKTCIFLVYPMKLVIQFHVVQCHGLSFQLMSSIRVNSVHGTFLQKLARLVLSQKRAKKRVPIKILH